MNRDLGYDGLSAMNNFGNPPVRAITRQWKGKYGASEHWEYCCSGRLAWGSSVVTDRENWSVLSAIIPVRHAGEPIVKFSQEKG